MRSPATDRDLATLTRKEVQILFAIMYDYGDGNSLAVERLKGHLTACGFSYEHNEDAVRVGGWIVALWNVYF